MSQDAVTNSTCLIGLEQVGQLNLLRQLFTQLYVPPIVQAEFGLSVDWLSVKPVQNIAVLIALKTQVDDGEAEAIALAMELKDVSLILDDKKARRIAQAMGLKVIGTVGILLQAKQKGLIPEVQPVLNALKQVNFYLSDSLYREALCLVGEEIS